MQFQNSQGKILISVYLIYFCIVYRMTFVTFMKRITLCDLLYVETACVLHNCRLMHESYGKWRHVSA